MKYTSKLFGVLNKIIRQKNRNAIHNRNIIKKFNLISCIDKHEKKVEEKKVEILQSWILNHPPVVKLPLINGGISIKDNIICEVIK